MTPTPHAEVTVTVPATSANLGPGFDALGLALSLRDEVRVRLEQPSAPEVTVHVDGEGAGAVPRDGSHLVVRAFHAVYDRLGLSRPHLSMWCTNRVPHGRGLGSSAAAAVAGVLAAQVLSRTGRDDEAALAVAGGIEGHPDNAAACLLGGLTVAWTEEEGPRAVRAEPVAGLRATVLVPATELSTETARGLLPATVPHADAAHSAGRAALLVEALTRRPDLLLPATEDRLHQRYRADAMPATSSLVDELRGRGLAATVSGAGPSVLVLGPSGSPPVEAPPGWTALDLAVDTRGAEVSDRASG
ncbi:MAG TPA: homoserine kinase [Actinomycetes bacterium]|nr:homoserine kinase [Actinomycetes bacterium]